MFDEYDLCVFYSNEESARVLIKHLKLGWVIVDKLPYDSQSHNSYQYYILGRMEAAKQLYEKSSK